jgi:hypothetical protein
LLSSCRAFLVKVLAEVLPEITLHFIITHITCLSLHEKNKYILRVLDNKTTEDNILI